MILAGFETDDARLEGMVSSTGAFANDRLRGRSRRSYRCGPGDAGVWRPDWSWDAVVCFQLDRLPSSYVDIAKWEAIAHEPYIDSQGNPTSRVPFWANDTRPGEAAHVIDLGLGGNYQGPQRETWYELARLRVTSDGRLQVWNSYWGTWGVESDAAVVSAGAWFAVRIRVNVAIDANGHQQTTPSVELATDAGSPIATAWTANTAFAADYYSGVEAAPPATTLGSLFNEGVLSIDLQGQPLATDFLFGSFPQPGSIYSDPTTFAESVGTSAHVTLGSLGGDSVTVWFDDVRLPQAAEYETVVSGGAASDWDAYHDYDFAGNALAGWYPTHIGLLTPASDVSDGSWGSVPIASHVNAGGVSSAAPATDSFELLTRTWSTIVDAADHIVGLQLLALTANAGASSYGHATLWGDAFSAAVHYQSHHPVDPLPGVESALPNTPLVSFEYGEGTGLIRRSFDAQDQVKVPRDWPAHLSMEKEGFSPTLPPGTATISYLAVVVESAPGVGAVIDPYPHWLNPDGIPSGAEGYPPAVALGAPSGTLVSLDPADDPTLDVEHVGQAWAELMDDGTVQLHGQVYLNDPTWGSALLDLALVDLIPENDDTTLAVALDYPDATPFVVGLITGGGKLWVVADDVYVTGVGVPDPHLFDLQYLRFAEPSYYLRVTALPPPIGQPPPVGQPLTPPTDQLAGGIVREDDDDD